MGAYYPKIERSVFPDDMDDLDDDGYEGDDGDEY